MFLWFLSLKLLILTCVPIGFAINSETFLTVSLKKSRFLFMTLKAGIEQAIKKAVPEITHVEAVNFTNAGTPADMMPERA